MRDIDQLVFFSGFYNETVTAQTSSLSFIMACSKAEKCKFLSANL